MCTHCGCSISTASEQPPEPAAEDPQPGRDTTAVGVFQSLLVENDHQATHNRRHFDTHGVLAINLMSSPGAGKTALLESTIDGLGERCRIAVIEGDLATENDARRIRAKGVNAVQISTGTA
ncbi:MAG: hydrogenase accessory protein HypB, partial [Gammaproteobacteria bacterium]|nr:hydrogenase accessory protein HypB [Gammaproteobacteria bacterium]